MLQISWYWPELDQFKQDVMKKLYSQTNTEDWPEVAYKGGCYEKKLLQAIGIPHLNLETFGCPKFNDMPQLAQIGSCGEQWCTCTSSLPSSRVLPFHSVDETSVRVTT